MLLPKGGLTWKSAQSRLPPLQAIWSYVFRARFLLLVGTIGTFAFLWSTISNTAADMQR
jgi:hypothetical protein